MSYQNQSGAAGANFVVSSQTAPPPKPMTALEEQVARLNESANDIGHLANRLHELADRTFGPMPANAGKDPVAPSPTHTLGKLVMAHEFMAAVRSRLRDAVDRLESL